MAGSSIASSSPRGHAFRPHSGGPWGVTYALRAQSVYTTADGSYLLTTIDAATGSVSIVVYGGRAVPTYEERGGGRRMSSLKVRLGKEAYG